MNLRRTLVYLFSRRTRSGLFCPVCHRKTCATSVGPAKLYCSCLSRYLFPPFCSAHIICDTYRRPPFLPTWLAKRRVSHPATLPVKEGRVRYVSHAGLAVAVARESLVWRPCRYCSGPRCGQCPGPTGPVRPAHLQAPVPGERAAANRALNAIPSLRTPGEQAVNPPSLYAAHKEHVSEGEIGSGAARMR